MNKSFISKNKIRYLLFLLVFAATFLMSTSTISANAGLSANPYDTAGGVGNPLNLIYMLGMGTGTFGISLLATVRALKEKSIIK